MNQRLTNATLLLALAPAIALYGQGADPAAENEDVIQLEAFEVTGLKTFSDQAIPGETPVSFTEVTKESIQAELGSRDIPLLLNNTPSVYATTDSGGAGDARVSIRGFNQRNINIMINGVPTNDIENGWLYWSNWDGLGDVTSTIQVQRGLSNVTLPTPSIGGTMNIITDPAGQDAGGSVKLEVGSYGFRKATLVYNTGLLKDTVAFTFGLLAKKGDGYADGLWTKGTGYYFGATILVNERNRIELFAMGAPQRHGQRTFASNIAAYDADYARKLGYSEEDLQGALARGPVDAGHNFNPNWAPVSPSYTGEQYFLGSTHPRYDRTFINERENYFHKPQVNLNWFSEISDRTSLGAVLYYSGGRGGGSGTRNNTENVYGFNSSSRAFARYPNDAPLYGSAINWDATIAANAGTRTVRDDRDKIAGESLAILRNSVNEQDQFGAIVKLTQELSDAFKITGGLDWRTATIDHYREVRDLLGGDYFKASASDSSDFWPEGPDTKLYLGDKLGYFNTNTVDWLGLFLQGQYKAGPITAFGVYGYSTIDYTFTDHFTKGDDGNPVFLAQRGLDGHQVKGGVTYAMNKQLSFYLNAGWVSKAPIFDGAIDDVTGTKIPPINEKFTSFETGMRWESPDRKFNVNAGLYHTLWRDRTFTRVSEQNDETIITYQRGIDSDYSGIEIEAAWKPNRYFRFDLASSFGDWKYADDAYFEQVNVDTGEKIPSDDKLYLKDLKVGDMPQTQIAYAFTVYPVKGLSVKFQGRWYDRFYADYEPSSRTDPEDRAQPWEIPSYDIYDLHVWYTLPFNLGDNTRIKLFAHVFNLFDKTYVSDAKDESRYEAISGAPKHSAQRAEAFLGAPRITNVGVVFEF